MATVVVILASAFLLLFPVILSPNICINPTKQAVHIRLLSP